MAENPALVELSIPAESAVSASSAEPYREIIEHALDRGRNAMGIWQYLISDQGSAGSYESVKGFVRKLPGVLSPEAAGIIQTEPGEEAQVDYGTASMVRDPKTGKCRGGSLRMWANPVQWEAGVHAPQVAPVGTPLKYNPGLNSGAETGTAGE